MIRKKRNKKGRKEMGKAKRRGKGEIISYFPDSYFLLTLSRANQGDLHCNRPLVISMIIHFKLR